MKQVLIPIVLSLALIAIPSLATPAKKGALDKEPDLFALVTPDRLLGDMTRREWLTLWPVDGREYWAAWDCKGQPCDTAERAHIRKNAKLIPRTDADPKPITGQSRPKG